MKKAIVTLLILFFIFSPVRSQEMNPEKLKGIIVQVSDTLQNNGNAFQFMYKQKLMICIYDEKANRMRIISPIVKREELEEDELLNALVANFHSALDVKYALSDEVIWSVYTHPLQELSEGQVLDALEQVFSAAVTFGTTYSSTNLVFPGNTKKKDTIVKNKILKKT